MCLYFLIPRPLHCNVFLVPSDPPLLQPSRHTETTLHGEGALLGLL